MSILRSDKDCTQYIAIMDDVNYIMGVGFTLASAVKHANEHMMPDATQYTVEGIAPNPESAVGLQAWAIPVAPRLKAYVTDNPELVYDPVCKRYDLAP